jgi:hypothetical protein
VKEKKRDCLSVVFILVESNVPTVLPVLYAVIKILPIVGFMAAWD